MGDQRPVYDFSQQAPDLSGQVELLKPLPVFYGPYSSVYRGILILKDNRQPVAIKVLKPIDHIGMTTLQRKLNRERWTWSVLRHDNILPLYGYAEDVDLFGPFGAFISPVGNFCTQSRYLGFTDLQWLFRGDLAQYLKSEGLSAPLDERLKLWMGVVAGVAYLHSHDPVVIHGDLKPRNVLIDDHGNAKICDFGLVRLILEEGKCGMTTTTAHAGTQRYLAYELVFADVVEPSTPSDIYATGCIGLEAIFQELPYSKYMTEKNLEHYMRKDMQDGIPPASRPNDCPLEIAPLWEIVSCCWEFEAASRPSAQELSQRLENFITPTRLSPRRPIGYTDPLRRFPTEISLLCIREVLPYSSNYTPVLLELMSVSPAWQGILLSSPILWSQLHIQSTVCDLPSVLAVSLHLSRFTRLKLFIWDGIGPQWESIVSLLLPHRSRISSLHFPGPDSAYFSAEATVGILPYHRMSLMLAQSFGGLPGLIGIDLGHTLRLDSPEPYSLGPPVTSHVHITQLSKLWNLDRFASIGTEISSLDNIEATLPYLPKISTLQLHSLQPTDVHTLSRMIPQGSLNRLKELTVRQPAGDSLEHLISFTGPRMTSLSIQTPISNVAAMIEILLQLVNLQELKLDLINWDTRDVPSHAPYGVVVADLWKISVIATGGIALDSLGSGVVYESGPLVTLFEAFTELYPFVTNVSFEGDKDILNFAHSYLRSLRFIESLSILGVRLEPSTYSGINLPSLRELTTECPVSLRYLNVPNLLYLNITRLTTYTDLASLRFRRLRKLLVYVYATPAVDPNSTLVALNYPELLQLYIRIDWRQSRWKLTSFPRLVSINFDSVLLMNPHGNSLCMALIQQPDHCPSLQQIRFSDFVEWDLLFLMLERRNYGLRGVKRIHTIEVPFVPSGLRWSLSCLLEGRKRPGIHPFKYDISLDATREILCDAKIPGCFSCLKNFRPCSEEIEEPRTLDVDALFSEYPDTPVTIPSQIRAYLAEHRNLVNTWKTSFALAQLKFRRRRLHRSTDGVACSMPFDPYETGFPGSSGSLGRKQEAGDDGGDSYRA